MSSSIALLSSLRSVDAGISDLYFGTILFSGWGRYPDIVHDFQRASVQHFGESRYMQIYVKMMILSSINPVQVLPLS